MSVGRELDGVRREGGRKQGTVRGTVPTGGVTMTGEPGGPSQRGDMGVV